MHISNLNNTKVTELNLGSSAFLETACPQDACAIAMNEEYNFEVFVENASFFQIESYQLVELIQQTFSRGTDKVVRFNVHLRTKRVGVLFLDTRF